MNSGSWNSLENGPNDQARGDFCGEVFEGVNHEVHLPLQQGVLQLPGEQGLLSDLQVHITTMENRPWNSQPEDSVKRALDRQNYYIVK